MSTGMRGTGGQFGIVLGASGAIGTWMGREVATFQSLPLEMTVVAVSVAMSVTAMCRAGLHGPRSRSMVGVLSVAILPAFVANAVLHSAGRGDRIDVEGGFPFASIEGVFVDGFRPDFTRDHSRDESSRISHVARFRIDSSGSLGNIPLPLDVGDTIRVRVASGSPNVQAGVRYSILGRLAPRNGPVNPGATRSRGPGPPPSLVVPSPQLMHPVIDHGGGIVIDWWIAIVSEVRSRLRSGIDGLSGFEGARNESLLLALLTGARDELDPETRAAFKRSGVSHLLAISGLHLAVVASIPWTMLGVAGVGRPMRCVVTGMFVAAGVVMIESSPSVIRSASMLIPIMLVSAFGLNVRVLPLLGTVAGVMLWIHPDWIDSPGFQLSFVACSALVIGGEAARRSWFGGRDSAGTTRWSLIRDPWSRVASASIVACLATLPIVESRFGLVPIAIVPASIVLTPMIFAFLVIAVPMAMASMVLPGAADVFAPFVTACDRFVIEMVRSIADASPAVVATDPGFWWTSGATVLGVAAPTLPRRRLVRRAGWTIFLAMVLVPLTPILDSRIRDRLQVDMLAVGDGTAILVRTAESTVLFDAGSSSLPGFGVDTIFRGLRGLGVRRLDGIVISHANTDHYGAVAALVEMIPTRMVVITAAFLRRIDRRDGEPAASSLVAAIDHPDSIRIVEQGDHLPFPDGSWSVLHPSPSERHRGANDESIVLRVDGPGRDPRLPGQTADLILFGDLETAGVARLMRDQPHLRARIMELPHHGSWRPVVSNLIDRVDPRVILQSTGPRRFESDRYAVASRNRVRLVTCRDGSGMARIGFDDSMTVASVRNRINATLRPDR